MPSISPGQSARTAPAERLRLVLTGSGAAACSVELEGDTALQLRMPNPTTCVIDASESGSATLRLVTGTPGQRMSGTLRVTVEPMPVDGAAPAAAGRQKWDLPRVPVEGRLRLDLLAVQRFDDKHWELTSLLTEADDTRDPLVRAARHSWGDRDKMDHRLLVAVDRSASMAWCYRPGGALDSIGRAVAAVATAVMRQPEVAWASYGSGADDADGLRHLTPGAPVGSLRPELFSSGSAPRLALSAARDRYDHVLFITDSLAELALAMDADVSAVRVSVVVAGASDQDERYLPQEEVNAGAVVRAAGAEVLGLPDGLTRAHGGVSPGVASAPSSAEHEPDSVVPGEAQQDQPDAASHLVCQWLTEQIIGIGSSRQRERSWRS